MLATTAPERACPGAALRYGRGASDFWNETNDDCRYSVVIGVSSAGPVSKPTTTDASAARRSSEKQRREQRGEAEGAEHC